MAEPRVPSEEEPRAVYDIRLRGTSAEPLRQHFPRATVLTSRTETVLLRRVDEPAELDTLIEQLLSHGPGADGGP